MANILSASRVTWSSDGSENGMGGITVFGHDDGGQPVALNDTSDSSATGLSDPAALASTVFGGQTYVFASSGNETALSAFRLEPSGSLTLVETLTANDGLWVSNTTTLVATSVGGNRFCCLGLQAVDRCLLLRLIPQETCKWWITF